MAASALLIGAVVCITIDKIKEKMLEHNCEKALIKTINSCTNQITLKDLDSEDTFVIEGDSILDDIYEGQVIYA